MKRLLESHGFVLAELIGVRDASGPLKTVVWVARQGGRPQVAGDGGTGGAGRRTDATPRLNAGAAWVDLQALLEHVDLATTQMDTHMDQDRMAAVVNTL